MISPYTAKQACPDCGGKGWIERKCLNPDEARVCPHCNGSGLTPLEKESALAAAGSSVDGFGAILGLHGLAAASTPA